MNYLELSLLFDSYPTAEWLFPHHLLHLIALNALHWNTHHPFNNIKTEVVIIFVCFMWYYGKGSYAFYHLSPLTLPTHSLSLSPQHHLNPCHRNRWQHFSNKHGIDPFVLYHRCVVTHSTTTIPKKIMPQLTSVETHFCYLIGAKNRLCRLWLEKVYIFQTTKIRRSFWYAKDLYQIKQ